MYRHAAVLITAVLICAVSVSCSPEPRRIVIVPTMMEMPTVTETALSTETVTATMTAAPPVIEQPTHTETPVPTLPPPTSDDPTLAAAQAEIAALQITIAAMASPTPSATPSPTRQIPVMETDPQWFVARQNTSLRECPDRACAEILFVTADSRFTMDAFVYGEDVDMGNQIWLRVTGYPQIGYIYSGAAVPLSPAATTVSTAETTAFPTLPAAIPGICPGENVRCSQLSTCEQALACLAAGQSRLDNDGDGIPCEALCAPGN